MFREIRAVVSTIPLQFFVNVSSSVGLMTIELVINRFFYIRNVTVQYFDRKNNLLKVFDRNN